MMTISVNMQEYPGNEWGTPWCHGTVHTKDQWQNGAASHRGSKLCAGCSAKYLEKFPETDREEYAGVERPAWHFSATQSGLREDVRKCKLCVEGITDLEQNVLSILKGP